MEDLYFEQNYGRLYEQIEDGKCEVYEYHSPTGSIRHIFIKRKICTPVDGEFFYDITTPYGYGGPLITSCVDGKEHILAKEFEESFGAYCGENQIISEFVRFHPLFFNAQHFSNCYHLSFRSKTTGTTIASYVDPVQEEFSKSTRKIIRKALNAGVTYRVTPNPPCLKEFQKIYLKTMHRIGASDVYFFDDEYFSKCLHYFGEKIILVEALYNEEIIGMELHFHYNNRIHTHLSGSLEEYHYLSPVYIMTYAIAEWGKANGVELIHAGGGLTSEPDDKLFLFKKKFGKNTEFHYFTGTKIWNENIYSNLCEEMEVKTNSDFFPSYRTTIQKTAKV